MNTASPQEIAQFLDWVFESEQFYADLADITKQSSNIGQGYLSQMLVTLLTGTPGTKSGSDGDDLADGSEVKSAMMDFRKNPSGKIRSTDFARYNMLHHALKAPHIYLVRWELHKNYLMVCVSNPETKEFRSLIERYLQLHSSKNMQLHPFWEPPILTAVSNTAGYPIEGLPKRRPRGIRLKVMMYAIKQNSNESWEITFNDDSTCWLVKNQKMKN